MLPDRVTLQEYEVRGVCLFFTNVIAPDIITLLAAGIKNSVDPGQFEVL